MNKNKGFTLIELLAVIVVLAIIAFIATPIILGVIDKAKKGAANASALGYIDAVEKYMIISQLDSSKVKLEPGVYQISNPEELTLIDYIIPKVYAEGTIYLNDIITIKGDKPKKGWVEVSNKKVEDYSLVVDNFVITKDQEITKGDTPAEPGGIPVVKTYTLGQLVYFDPVSENKCDETTFNLDNIKSKTSTCYKWRVMETEDSTSKSDITLQLDHNSVNLSVWSSTNNLSGPTTALSQLATSTNSWVRVPLLNYTYSGQTGSYGYGVMTCTDGTCKLSNNSTVSTNTRARMITTEEIINIIKTKLPSFVWSKETNTNYFYYSNTAKIMGTTTNGTGNTDLSWTLENTNFASAAQSTENLYDVTNHGYWTLSTDLGHNNYAWVIDRGGSLYNYQVNNTVLYGVRPVITISKSLLN